MFQVVITNLSLLLHVSVNFSSKMQQFPDALTIHCIEVTVTELVLHITSHHITFTITSVARVTSTVLHNKVNAVAEINQSYYQVFHLTR